MVADLGKWTSSSMPTLTTIHPTPLTFIPVILTGFGHVLRGMRILHLSKQSKLLRSCNNLRPHLSKRHASNRLTRPRAARRFIAPHVFGEKNARDIVWLLRSG